MKVGSDGRRLDGERWLDYQRRRVRPLRERFLEKVSMLPDAPGCWLWTGSLNDKDYPNISHEKRTMYAHQAAWLLFRGSIPEGMDVCHRCDVPQCVNPWHLFLGTHEQNMDDMVRKDRVRHGRNHPHAKLTEEQVREIRAVTMRPGGPRVSTIAACVMLAKRYGVSVGTIHGIRAKSGKGFRHWTRVAAIVAAVASPALAQDGSIRSFATQETLLKPGANRTMIFGARAVAKYTLGDIADRAVRIYGRAQASAIPDGGAKFGRVTIDNLESYQSLELVGGIEIQGYGDFYVTAFAGTALQIESGRPKAIQDSPFLAGVGIRRSLRYTEEPGWVFGGACINQAIGKDTPIGCASVQLPVGNVLGGRVSLIGDVYGPGTKAFARVGVAVGF